MRGCGTGENALYLAHLGFEAGGIDATQSAIKKAREKVEERGINVNFLGWRCGGIKCDLAKRWTPPQ